MDLPAAQQRARALADGGRVGEHWLLDEGVQVLLHGAPASSGAATLRLTLSGARGTTSFELAKPLVTIGKAGDNDLVVFDADVAPYHLVIRQTADGVFLGILDRVRRILVNDQPQDRDLVPLRRGDVVRMADWDGGALTVDWSEEASADYRAEARDTLTRLVWLQGLPLFGLLAPEDLAELARGAGVRVYRQGAYLCREGDESHGAFAILSGQCRAYSGDGPLRRETGILGEGRLVGELSILTGRAYNATVQVDSASATVLALGRDALRRLMAEQASVANAILAQVMEHLASGGAELCTTMTYDPPPAAAGPGPDAAAGRPH